MKNRKLLRAAATLLLVGIVGVASVGCSFELEEPKWVTQALCDHVFDEEEVLKEATCTEDGKIQKTCSDCGKTKITTVKATGHDVVDDEAVDATCTMPGLTAGSHCTACGEVLVKQEEVLGIHVDDDEDALCDVCIASLTTTGLKVEVGDVYAGEPIAGNFYRVYRYQESKTLGLSNLKDSNLVNLLIDTPSGMAKDYPFVFVNHSPSSSPSVLVFSEAEYIDFYFESIKYTSVLSGVDCTFTVTDETRFIDYGDLEIYRLNVSAQERCSLGAHNIAEWTTVVEPTCIATGEKSGTCTFCAAQRSRVIEKIEHPDVDKNCLCDECNATFPETTYHREVREYDATSDTVTGHWWRVYYDGNEFMFEIVDGAIEISYYTGYGLCLSARTESGNKEFPTKLSETNVQYCTYKNYVDIYFDASISYIGNSLWSKSYTVSETAIFEIEGDFSIYLIEP